MNKLSEVFRRVSDSFFRNAQDRDQLLAFGAAAAGFYAYGNVDTAYLFAAVPTISAGLGLSSLVLAKGVELVFPPEVLRVQKLGKAARQFVALAEQAIKKSDIPPALSSEDAAQTLGEDALADDIANIVNASRLTTYLSNMTDEEHARLNAFDRKEGWESLSQTGRYSNQRSIVEAEIYANIAERIGFSEEIKKSVPYWVDGKRGEASFDSAGAPSVARLCTPQ